LAFTAARYSRSDSTAARFAQDGVVIAAETQVDVRRHVHEMSDGRRQGTDAVGGGKRLGGCRRRLVQVDSVVMRAGMVWREPRRAVQQRHHFGRPGLRRPVGPPVVVRVRVHDRFGGQHGDVGIVRIARREPAHGVRVVLRQLVDVRFRIVAVAARERLDQRALARSKVRRIGARLHDRVDRDRDIFALHVVIDAGAQCPCDAPPAHRAVEVGERGGAERTHRFGEVEPQAEDHALVEQLLRAIVGRHARRLVRADRQQLRFRGRQRACVVQADGPRALGLRERGARAQEGGEHDEGLQSQAGASPTRAGARCSGRSSGFAANVPPFEAEPFVEEGSVHRVRLRSTPGTRQAIGLYVLSLLQQGPRGSAVP
jgi:hypothetical protein